MLLYPKAYSLPALSKDYIWLICFRTMSKEPNCIVDALYSMPNEAIVKIAMNFEI